MSRCKANPCCSDPYNCTVPLPQHRTGLVHLNKGLIEQAQPEDRPGLLPCPFCGGAAQVNCEALCCIIRCGTCRASISIVSEESFSEVVARWNSRTDTPSQSLRSQAGVSEAVAFVSPEQFEDHGDPSPDEEPFGGLYLPVRLTRAGNFTMPLFARPAPIEITEEQALIRDLADCLEDMTKHYVEVRNDLYGFEAAEEIEVIAAGKLISKAKSQQEGETE